MKKFILLGYLFLQFSSFLFSQDVEESKSASVLLRKEINFGIILHTEGFGVNYTFSKNKTISNRILYEIDFVSMKNPKQTSISSAIADGTYIYGKENSFFILRGGIGRYGILYSKDNSQAIEVRMITSVGISLGILKPYYLEIQDPVTNNTSYQTFNASHNAQNIVGSASFFRGIGETSFNPGIYAKLGFGFNYGKTNAKVEMLEVGAILDAYPRKVYLMYNDGINQNLFMSFYIKIAFGKRSL